MRYVGYIVPPLESVSQMTGSKISGPKMNTISSEPISLRKLNT